MFSWLFGNSEGANKTIENVSNGIDKIWHTDEEKSDAQQKAFETFIKYQEATQPQNQARRLIAMMIVGLFVFLVLLGVLVWPWMREYSSFIFEILTSAVLPLTITIIMFYFYKRIKGKG